MPGIQSEIRLHIDSDDIAMRQTKEAFRRKVTYNGAYRRISGKIENFDETLLELIKNSYDSFIDRLEESATKPVTMDLIIKLEAYYDGDDIIVSVTDNGKPVDLRPDGRPAYRRRTSRKHFGGGHRGIRAIIEPALRTMSASIKWQELENGTKTQIRIPKKTVRHDGLINDGEYIIIEAKHDSSLMARAAFRDMSIMIGRYLGIGISEHTLKKHIKGHSANLQKFISEMKERIPASELEWSRTTDPILKGFDIDGLTYDENEKSFCLPVYRDGAKAFVYKYYIHGDPKEADMTIPLGDGTNVYVKTQAVPGYKAPAQYPVTGRANRKGLPAGSIPSVFAFLCDNSITSAETALAAEEIAEKLDRSYETIKYDLRGLSRHLRLIDKAGSHGSGKEARYYVPESVAIKRDAIAPALSLFLENDIRPTKACLELIRELFIRPLFVSAELFIENRSSFDVIVQRFEAYYREITAYLGSMKLGKWTEDPKAFYGRISSYRKIMKAINNNFINNFDRYCIAGTPLAEKYIEFNNTVVSIKKRLSVIRFKADRYIQNGELDILFEPIREKYEELRSAADPEQLYDELRELFNTVVDRLENHVLVDMENTIDREYGGYGLRTLKSQIAILSDVIDRMHANIPNIDIEPVLTEQLKLAGRVEDILLQIKDVIHRTDMDALIDMFELSYQLTQSDSRSDEDAVNVPRGRPAASAPKSDLELFMCIIEDSTPSRMPAAGSEEEQLLEFTLPQLRLMLNRPELSWPELEALETAANRRWKQLGSVRRAWADNATEILRVHYMRPHNIWGKIPALTRLIEMAGVRLGISIKNRDRFQTLTEQKVFWSINLCLIPFIGKIPAIAIVWSAFFFLHFVRTKNMPQAPPWNRVLVVATVNAIAIFLPEVFSIPQLILGFVLSTAFHHIVNIWREDLPSEPSGKIILSRDDMAIPGHIFKALGFDLSAATRHDNGNGFNVATAPISRLNRDAVISAFNLPQNSNIKNKTLLVVSYGAVPVSLSLADIHGPSPTIFLSAYYTLSREVRMFLDLNAASMADDPVGAGHSGVYKYIKLADDKKFSGVSSKETEGALRVPVLPGVFHGVHDSSIISAKATGVLARPGVRVLVLGTGMGLESTVAVLMGATVEAVDIKEMAVENTKLTAEKAGVHVSAYTSDLFSRIGKNEKFDLIVFNMPHVINYDAATASQMPGLTQNTADRGGVLLARLAPQLPERLNEGGIAVLVNSKSHADFIMKTLGDQPGLRVTTDYTRESWVSQAYVAYKKTSKRIPGPEAEQSENGTAQADSAIKDTSRNWEEEALGLFSYTNAIFTDFYQEVERVMAILAAMGYTGDSTTPNVIHISLRNKFQAMNEQADKIEYSTDPSPGPISEIRGITYYDKRFTDNGMIDDTVIRRSAAAASDPATLNSVKDILLTLELKNRLSVRSTDIHGSRAPFLTVYAEPLSNNKALLNIFAAYLAPFIYCRANGMVDKYSAAVREETDGGRAERSYLMRILVRDIEKDSRSWTQPIKWVPRQGRYAEAALRKKMTLLKPDKDGTYNMRLYFAGVGNGEEIEWAINTIDKFAGEFGHLRSRLKLHIRGGDIRFTCLYMADERARKSVHPNVKVDASFEWINFSDYRHMSRLAGSAPDFAFCANLFYFHFRPSESSGSRIWQSDELRRPIDAIVNSLPEGAYLFIENTIDDKGNLIRSDTDNLFAHDGLRLLTASDLNCPPLNTPWTGVFERNSHRRNDRAPMKPSSSDMASDGTSTGSQISDSEASKIIDSRPINAGLLDELYVRHDTIVHKAVMPLAKKRYGEGKNLIALYGGAGADISNCLLSLDSDTNYFVSDDYNLTAAQLKDSITHYKEIYELGAEAFSDAMKKIYTEYMDRKKVRGFGQSSDIGSPESLIRAIAVELWALGVDFRTLTVTDDRGCPKIQFDWDHVAEKRSRAYSITLINADITAIGEIRDRPPDRRSDSENRLLGVLNHGIDLYYQRAGLEIPYAYAESPNFISTIHDAMAPDGFLITDDYGTKPAVEPNVSWYSDCGKEFPVNGCKYVDLSSIDPSLQNLEEKIAALRVPYMDGYSVRSPDDDTVPWYSPKHPKMRYGYAVRVRRANAELISNNRLFPATTQKPETKPGSSDMSLSENDKQGGETGDRLAPVRATAPGTASTSAGINEPDRIVFIHTPEDRNITALEDAELLWSSRDFGGYYKAVTQHSGRDFSKKELYQLSICLNEIRSNTNKFSKGDPLLSSALYRRRADKTGQSYVLKYVFSQEGAIEEPAWEIIEQNLHGYLRSGPGYLKDTKASGAARKKWVAYSNTGQGLATVGLLMDMTPVVLEYRKTENGLQTTIWVELDNLLTPAPRERPSFELASNLTEDQLYDDGISALVIEAQRDAGFWAGWRPDMWDGRHQDAMILFSAGKPTGIYAFIINSDNEIQANGIYISKEARYSGIGSVLRDELLRHLEKLRYRNFVIGGKGVNHVRLSYEAQRFHEKLDGVGGIDIIRDRDGSIEQIDIDLRKYAAKRAGLASGIRDQAKPGSSDMAAPLNYEPISERPAPDIADEKGEAVPVKIHREASPQPAATIHDIALRNAVRQNSPQTPALLPGAALEKEVETYLRVIGPAFFAALERHGLSDVPEMNCIIASKLLAKVISLKFNIPLGGDSSVRLQIISGYRFDKDRNATYHRWIGLYSGGEMPYLYIDASYGQFDPRYINTIVTGKYQRSLTDKRLAEFDSVLRESMRAYLPAASPHDININDKDAVIGTIMPLYQTDANLAMQLLALYCEYQAGNDLRNKGFQPVTDDVDKKIEAALLDILSPENATAKYAAIPSNAPTDRTEDYESGSPSIETERVHAIELSDSVKLIRAANQAQPVVLALGTSWIKGYRRGDARYNDINRLITAIRNFCAMHGINFVNSDDDNLLTEINKKRQNMPGAKIIVLAGKDSITPVDAILASLRNDPNAFLAAVDNSKLDETCYMRIAEMLRMALELGLKEIFRDMISLDNPNIKTDPLNDFRNVYVFIPKAERIPIYENLRALYRVQEFA